MSTQKNLFQFFTKIPTPKSSTPKEPLSGIKDRRKSDTTKSPKIEVSSEQVSEEKCLPKISEDESISSKVSKLREEASLKKTPKRSREQSFSASFEDSFKEKKDQDEDDENMTVGKNRRRRIIIHSESDDSEDDYKPEKDAASSDESYHSDNEKPKSPKKKKQKMETPLIPLENFKCAFSWPKSGRASSISSPKTPLTPKTNTKLISDTPNSKQKKLANGASKEENVDVKHFVEREWMHETIDFLKDGSIKDKFGKPKSDPNYNPRSLFVPDHFKKNQTPAMKQWWDLKSDHYDTVLFFKVGKFYELYHMDACIGVKELGLIFMKGEWAHSGFPEIAFGRFSECLVERGYKVARVEQTETPLMMEERCRKMSRTTKFDKVVNREICQITTRGTKTLTYQDETISISNNFLLAICEKPVEGAEIASEYGICFIDTSIGKFTLGQFQDDRHGSRILTLIALYPAVEILYDRSSVTKKTRQLLDNNLSGATKEALSPNTQFWAATKVLKYLNGSGHFEKEGNTEWPQTILQMLNEDDILHETPKKQYELALKSLGACIWYLKRCGIEDCLLTMNLFEEYKPRDVIKSETSLKDATNDLKKHMILDGITLQNLEVVPVKVSDNSEGTLLGTLNYCSTAFGKRLFRNWLCSPLYNPQHIGERLDAIDDLMAIPDVAEDTVEHLKKLPDLERLLSKIHAYGLSRSHDHPDTRAIFYEADSYNKTKILDLLSALEGFEEASKIISKFEEHFSDFKSCLLQQCTSTVKGIGNFPDISESLQFFDDAFDHETAKKEGSIIPSKGVDEEYDSARKEIKQTEKELNLYLEEQKSKLGCSIKYVQSGKNRYMFEISENKKPPSSYELVGSRKGYKRFYTSKIKDLISTLTTAEENRDSALRDCTRKIFSHFDQEYTMWKCAVNCIATLDSLISLVLFYNSSTLPVCRPEFSICSEDTAPHLEIIEGRHPTFVKYFTAEDYIPNSVYIGPKQEEEREDINNGGTLVLVTGPNMGGKSTLMRQAGTLVIMAHLGSYVPAKSMRLTPVDRIFTRVGANDHLAQGESTFFVEASETSCILHHATPHSFVLVDELGRGTSTYDGVAIANATLDYLANDICCRTLFSTHYHSLVDDFQNHPNVGLGHMACTSEKNYECAALEQITFLYKFINGACPKSYGFNVASLAGVPEHIVRQGFLKAQHLEYSTKLVNCLRHLLTKMKPEDIIEKLGDDLKLLNVKK